MQRALWRTRKNANLQAVTKSVTNDDLPRCSHHDTIRFLKSPRARPRIASVANKCAVALEDLNALIAAIGNEHQVLPECEARGKTKLAIL